MRVRSFALAAAALLAGLPAHSAVSIIGSGFARQCYEAAESGNRQRFGLDVCDRALSDEGVTVRDRAATLVNRGILKMQGRDFRGAIADYDQAIALTPKLGEAFVNKGVAQVNLGNADAQAVETLTHALALKPIRPEVAFYTRGVAHELAGDLQAAYEDYKAAAGLKPDWSVPAEQLKRFTVEKRRVGQG